jgi:Protein of unknown function (DUF1279)
MTQCHNSESSPATMHLTHCLQAGVGCPATEREANAEPEGWFQKTVAGGGSAALLAFLCNKALLPVRVPITVGLTPVVARWAPFQSLPGNSCGLTKQGQEPSDPWKVVTAGSKMMRLLSGVHV